MGTKSKSQEPTWTIARGQGQAGGGSGGSGTAAGSVARGQLASEDSDTGSDSPDLLRSYATVDGLLEEPKRTAGRATHEQSPRQATFAPSTRSNQDIPRSHSCRLEAAKLAVDAHKLPVSRCRQPAPWTKAGVGGMGSGKRRGTAADGSNTSVAAEKGGVAEGNPPAQKRACGGAGTGDRAGGNRGSGSSAVARPASSSEIETTEARRMDRKGKNCAVDPHGPPKLAASPASVGSAGGAGGGGAPSNTGGTQTESARSRSPVLNNTSSPPSEDGGSTAGGMAGANHMPPAATKIQPTPESSTGDARLFPAGANSCAPTTSIPASAPKGAGRGSSMARNPYHDEPKDAKLASANVPNPYAATEGGGRVPTVVHNPYGGTAGRLPAAGVVNPYNAVGAGTPRDPTATTLVRQPTRCSSHVEESPNALAEPSQTQSSSAGSTATPPEVRFETARQQLYKNPCSGATGRGWRGRGRGRGGGRGAGRGGKRGSTAPRPAQDALVGVWRNKPPKKKGERGSR